MSSPTSLPDASPTLFLDAASPRLAAGLRAAAGVITWRETEAEAGVGLFRCTDELLRAAGLGIGDLRAIVFCDGPGSLLGIRLAAISIRTWMALAGQGPASAGSLRVFAYRSLALVAADLIAGGEPPPFHVCSDARRETWNVVSVGPDGAIGEVRRSTAAELPQDGRSWFTPASFPHWQPLPAATRTAPYRPRLLPDLARRFPLCHETTAPDAFLTQVPTYREWKSA